jgi:RNA-binding protein YlmH
MASSEPDKIERLARDEGERILLRRAADKLEQCARKSIPVSTRFLSPAERALVERGLQALGGPAHGIAGGFPEAERAAIVFLPDWLEAPPEGEDSPVAVVRAEYDRRYAQISHRDVLGALMGLGVERDTVGDILPGEDDCNHEQGCVYFAVLREILPYVLDNLVSAGRARLLCREIAPGDAHPKAQEYTTVKDTLASLRLDGVAAAGFGLSREKAAELVRSGKVQVDGADCLKPDAPVAEGAAVSARGFGKIRLSKVGGLTKKGRISIEILRYL